MSVILYELSDTDGKVIESCTTASEIARIIGVKAHSVYSADLKKSIIRNRYSVRKIDRKLSRDRDIEILLDYDLARENLLNMVRRNRT